MRIFDFNQFLSMPKIFEYLGIAIRFYANEHEPIHVHALYDDAELKVEFEIVNKEIVGISYKRVAGKEDFSPTQLKELEKLVNEYKYLMVDEWINYFVLHAKPTLRKITKRIR